MPAAKQIGGRQVVLVTGADLARPALDLLAAYEVVFAGAAPDADEVVRLCRQHDPVAIIVRYSKITAQMMDAAPGLRVISKHGSGIDTIDVDAARARGIEVCAAAGANAQAVAEHTFALLLACAKSVVRMNERMHAGHWDKATHKSLELSGRTLGLVGLGAIGQKVATMANSFGMRVLGYDPSASPAPSGIERVALDRLWQEADAISLHCPLTAETRHMLNTSVFERCKRGVIVINTARGGLIDEDALAKAVREGQVGSAGIDSFAEEPAPPMHPFFSEPNIVLSPHIGGVSTDAYVNMGVAAARNLLEILAPSRTEAPVRA